MAMVSLCTWLTMACTGLLQVGGGTGPGSDIWKTYQRAERMVSAANADLVRGARLEANWLPDGKRFWYRIERKNGREFVLVNAERGAKALAFNHQRLAQALGAELGRKVEPGKLPFSSISLDDGLDRLYFRIGSVRWSCGLKDYRLERLTQTEGAKPSDVAPARQRVERTFPEAFLRDGQIVIRTSASEERALTTDGGPKTPYRNLWMSPSRRYLAATRAIPVPAGLMYNIESSPKEGLRPKLVQHHYALPGDPIDQLEVFCFDLQTGESRRAQCEAIDYGGVNNLRWKADGRRFTFERQYRGFQRETITEVDAETGASRVIVDETSSTFIFPPFRFAHYLDDTGEILWTSERDNWNHLYLYDADTGRVKNQVTSGPWLVRGVERVDAQARTITFMAGGVEADDDPYLVHYYRINFDGTGLVALTPGNGQHEVKFSPDRKYFIDSYSRVDLPPIHELRLTEDGSLIAKLEEADAADLLKAGVRLPEPFVAKGRDGKTDIFGVIYSPSKLEAGKRYPVIEDIYAGPQGFAVPKAFSATRGNQALAELGFFVVQIDGMGMGMRSKAFHETTYRNLGDSGFPDRILWMRAAAKKHPAMDLSRVGIFGVSAGGYNAARALIAHPEFYKAAVAICGNHDHRTDKLWWNEMWMGYPVGPHYADQSNIVQAAKLQGKLFLIHGELDDNVNPSASTLQFANALIKANKDFDLLLVPGAGHGFGKYERRRMWDFFVRNLQGVEPPNQYAFGDAIDNSVNVTIKNLLDQPVTLYWVSGPEQFVRYQTIEPGKTVVQPTFLGHSWEARVGDRAVSHYTAEPGELVWEIAASP